jgi:hypothetical protein
MTEPRSPPLQSARTVRQVASTNAQTQNAVTPRSTMSSNPSSVAVFRATESSRSAINQTPPHRQTMRSAPNLASKQFVPHRVREVLPPPSLQDVSPNNLENPNLIEDESLPTQQPATVTNPPTVHRNFPKPKLVR